MKLFTAPALFAAALVSAVVCIPFLPGAKENLEVFSLQVTLTTGGHGRVQVYFDTGQGFSEEQSASQPLRPGADPASYDLPLPSGAYRRFRFDPIDGDAPVTVQSMRIVSGSGHLVREIPTSAMTAAHDIAALHRKAGSLEIVPTARSEDPQMLIAFDPPLEIKPSSAILIGSAPWYALGIFAVVAACLLALDRAPPLRRGCAHVAHVLGATPRRAIFVVALVAVVASSYPVVFLGKSFVSPNMGTVLLYDGFPTLPGYASAATGNNMGSDIGAIMWQHVPLSMVEARALRHGEAPLWNRYNSAGTPLLGQGQSMFGDPLHFLVIAANGAAWAWDLKYLIAKWLFAVGMGLIVLRVGVVRSDREGLRSVAAATSSEQCAPASPALPEQRPPEAQAATAAAAALIVAAVAPFIGFFVYRFNHPAFFSLCYAPWPLYCWIRAVRAPTLRATFGWAAALMLANLALMNSGTAKEAYMLLLTMNLAGLCVLATAGRPWRERFAKLGVLAWAGLLFTLITAPIWGTFLHELHNAYTSYNAVSAYQIQPSLLLGAFDEIFYRPLMPANRTFNPSLNFVFLLGFLYFLATLRTQVAHRTAITLAIVSLLPLSLAFGLVPSAWIVRVPLLANVAHIDNTFSCALIVLWGVLAGVGFTTAADRLRTRDGRGDLVVVSLMLGALVFAWIAFRQVVHRPIFGPTFTVNPPGHTLAVAPFIWGYLASLLIAAAGLMLAVRRALVRGALTSALALVIALGVAVLCWRHGLQATSAGFETYVLRPTVRAPLHARSEAVAFLQAEQHRTPLRAYGLHGNLFPGWTAAYGIETIHGPDALMSPFYRELTGAMGGIERIWDWRLYLEPRNIATARPYLDSLNVRYYVDLHSDRRLLEPTLRAAKFADLDVYESPTAWPRAFFTENVITYGTVEELLGRIRVADGHPFAAVQTSDLDDAYPLRSVMATQSAARTEAASHYRLTENTTSFDIHATGAGAVVLLESWWPGDFRAFVNSQKARVLRFNHAFKGVAIPAPGDYHVEFKYVPKGWYRNLALCGIGLALLLGTALLVRRTSGAGDRG